MRVAARKTKEFVIKLSEKLIKENEELKGSGADFQFNSDGSITFNVQKELILPDRTETTLSTIDAVLAEVTVIASLPEK